MTAMRALALLALTTACTIRNPAFCASDGECTDPAAPICDLDGAFSGTSNHCIPVPDDCPVERCGCTPGEAFACELDQLTVCGEDGRSIDTRPCGLGCATDETRCLAFEPSNGLGPALEMAENRPAVSLPDGASIDTELGTVVDGVGNTIDVASMLVTQANGQPIRALLARSFVIGHVSVVGAHALAIVSPGTIIVNGLIDASAEGRRRGPGAVAQGAACVGGQSREEQGTFVFANGAGGGGNATEAGRGGVFSGTRSDGGASVGSFAPLIGGCPGGEIVGLGGGSTTARGGGGGGGVQVVSLVEVGFLSSGMIDVGGGGGENGAGGGSGGVVIIEAPRVRLDGSATGIAANGGSGGGCGFAGTDATPSNSPALAPQSCANSPHPGNGATGAIPPESGRSECSSGSCFLIGYAGGGGGGAGRALVVTAGGNIDMIGAPLLSVALSQSRLTPR
jgi:hypothetical protein